MLCYVLSSLSAAMTDLVLNENLKTTCEIIQFTREYVQHGEHPMCVYQLYIDDPVFGQQDLHKLQS